MGFNAEQYINDTKKRGKRVGLEIMHALMDELGRPDKKLKFIHVAGTNGKGSCCAYLNSILMEAGYKVGMHTSPFIEVFNERFRINGELISDDLLNETGMELKAACERMVQKGLRQPFTMELVVAAAFVAFEKAGVDIVVLETGLGGLNDCTNVIEKNEAAIISSIAMDHMDVLGDSLQSIARHKVGIAKSGSPLIIYDAPEEILKVFKRETIGKNIPIIKMDNRKINVIREDIRGSVFEFKGEFKGELKINMIGEHQIRNACLSVLAVNELRKRGYNISDENIKKGLEKTYWLGRLDIISENPLIILDGAHNEEGIKSLEKALELIKVKKRRLVFASMADKDWKKMTSIIAPHFDEIIATEIDYPRCLKIDELYDHFKSLGKSEIIKSTNLEDAIDKGISATGEHDVLVFAGSLYFVGYAMKSLKKRGFGKKNEM